jgi:zinc transporter ZupT
VIGSQFSGFASISLTLMLGMFLGGVPEAAASGSMLIRAGYRPQTIFGLWSVVLVAGVVAAAFGNLYIGNSAPFSRVFLEGVAGGAVLGMVAHAMIPEAIHDGRSLIVLPLVAGFLFALYLTVMQDKASLQIPRSSAAVGVHHAFLSNVTSKRTVSGPKLTSMTLPSFLARSDVM